MKVVLAAASADEFEMCEEKEPSCGKSSEAIGWMVGLDMGRR